MLREKLWKECFKQAFWIREKTEGGGREGGIEVILQSLHNGSEIVKIRHFRTKIKIPKIAFDLKMHSRAFCEKDSFAVHFIIVRFHRQEFSTQRTEFGQTKKFHTVYRLF